MASGDTLIIFHPYNNEPPASNYATLDLRNIHPCLDFDGTTAEEAVFTGILPRNYSGSGITVNLHHGGTATAGTVVYRSAFERIGDQIQDIDSDSFGTALPGTAGAPGTAGLIDILSIAHTNGTQIDSLAVGELFRIKIARNPSDAADNMVGDGELFAIELKET